MALISCVSIYNLNLIGYEHLKHVSSGFIFAYATFSYSQVSLGYDGCDFELVEEDTIVTLQGSFIALWNTSTGKKDYIQ